MTSPSSVVATLDRRSPQRERRREAGQKGEGLAVDIPAGKGERFETVLELIVRADRQYASRVASPSGGADPDEGDAQLVAQEPLGE